MLLKHYCVFTCVLLCSVFVVCENEPVVDSSHGKILGKVFRTLYKDLDYYGFMGIPYAAPPVKDLRFLPPQPIEPWDDVLDATKEKKACAQFNINVKKNPLGFYGSEDCLYLDIFTPALDDAKRAVIFFIYNEHFINSYNKTKDYQPDFFIEEDVVIVTISHRLSAFGFLSLEDETLWGNSGLKDIVAGLEWVRDNIEKFGGDPNQITLMGASGGAAAVDLLMHSKKKHLFKAAILHSGSSWSTGYLQDNVRERAFELARLMDKNPTTSETVLRDLNNAPVVNITRQDIHASPKDHFKETQRSVVSFGPIVEKDPNGLITDYPENSTNVDIPILIGFNSREGIEMSMQYLIEPRYMPYLNNDFPFLFPLRVNFRFDPVEDICYEAVDEIKDFYFPHGVKALRVSDFIDYIGDTAITYSVNHAARTYANISAKPLYYYYFDYYSDLNEHKDNLMRHVTVTEGTDGAATSDELCYLFKCPDIQNKYLKYVTSKPEVHKIQTKMVKMWSNFAKYGNPTPENDETLEGFKWPPYTTELKEYLHIAKELEIKQEVYKKNFQFWDDFFERWGQRAVNGVITKSVNKKDEL